MTKADPLLSASKNPLEQLLLDRVELPIGPIYDGKLKQFFARTEPCYILLPPVQKTLVNTELLRCCAEGEVSIQLEPAILSRSMIFSITAYRLRTLPVAPPFRQTRSERGIERGEGWKRLMQVRNASEVRQIWPTKCNAESYVGKKIFFNSYVVLVI